MSHQRAFGDSEYLPQLSRKQFTCHFLHDLKGIENGLELLNYFSAISNLKCEDKVGSVGSGDEPKALIFAERIININQNSMLFVSRLDPMELSRGVQNAD
jgi:hypothetical protein